MKQLGNHAKKSSFAMVYCQYFSVLASEKVKYFQHPNQLMGSQGVSEVKKKKKRSVPQYRKHGFVPYVRKIPWKRKWQPTPVFLPGKSNGQNNLAWIQSLGSQRSGELDKKQLLPRQ